MSGYLCRIHFPPINPPGLAGKIDTNFIYSAAIMLKRLGILLVFYLLEGIFGRLVKLELDDVNIILYLDEQVDAAIAGMMLHFCI